LCSPCHYTFTAYTTKNLKETFYTCTLQGPIHRCQNVRLAYTRCSAYFFLPFICLGIIFVYLKWPAYTWTAQQRKHPADRKRNTSIVAWFQATNTVGMRSALFWDFMQRRLVISYLRFVTTFGGGEILTAVLVKIQVIWDVSPFIFKANSPRWRH